ncbi:hypothetical protein CEXT_114621 [Caerostris extrusa]|uniref:Uncharacterized protein n=1 Tax=Caerostris extrusa TaxID=172846 RepID=A0AAV4X5K9_CAEEX|nr:hypothetical protein CEXT_114621 [Caerostris extrusa]
MARRQPCAWDQLAPSRSPGHRATLWHWMHHPTTLGPSHEILLLQHISHGPRWRDHDLCRCLISASVSARRLPAMLATGFTWLGRTPP